MPLNIYITVVRILEFKLGKRGYMYICVYICISFKMCYMVFEDVHLHLGLGPLGSTINKILKIIKIMLAVKKTPSFRSSQTEATWLEVEDSHLICCSCRVYLGRSQEKIVEN